MLFRTIRVEGDPRRGFQFAGRAAAWTTLHGLFPLIDPVEVGKPLVTGLPVQHMAVAGEVNQSVGRPRLILSWAAPGLCSAG